MGLRMLRLFLLWGQSLDLYRRLTIFFWESFPRIRPGHLLPRLSLFTAMTHLYLVQPCTESIQHKQQLHYSNNTYDFSLKPSCLHPLLVVVLTLMHYLSCMSFYSDSIFLNDSCEISDSFLFEHLRFAWVLVELVRQPVVLIPDTLSPFVEVVVLCNMSHWEYRFLPFSECCSRQWTLCPQHSCPNMVSFSSVFLVPVKVWGLPSLSFCPLQFPFPSGLASLLNFLFTDSMKIEDRHDLLQCNCCYNPSVSPF